MIHWSYEFVGKPWVSGCSGPEKYDCWGLVRHVYALRRGVCLPIVDLGGYSDAAAAHAFVHDPAVSEWQEVPEPDELDVLMFYKATWPVHVGLWLSGSKVLHCWQGAGVVVSDINAFRRLGFGKYKVLRYYGSPSSSKS